MSLGTHVLSESSPFIFHAIGLKHRCHDRISFRLVTNAAPSPAVSLLRRAWNILHAHHWRFSHWSVGPRTHALGSDEEEEGSGACATSGADEPSIRKSFWEAKKPYWPVTALGREIAT